MSIVTRHGDGGETGLLYGGRVAKDDPHTEAYGALDEAISALGVARAQAEGSPLGRRLLAMQRELFIVGAELATGVGHRNDLTRHFDVVAPALTEALDREVAELETRVELPRAFVIPGGSVIGAQLDVARTLVRRAERRAVTMHRLRLLENAEVLRYLNRLSDLIFLLAREAELGRTIAR